MTAIGRAAAAGLLACCLLTAGCGTVLRLADHGEPHENRLFMATRVDVGFIRQVFSGPAGDTRWGFEPVYFWWYTPVVVADIPFAVALDTVLLPADLIRYARNRSHERENADANNFWESAFRTGMISVEGAQRHPAKKYEWLIRPQLGAHRGASASEVKRFLLDYAMTNDMPELLIELSECLGLSDDQYRRLYATPQSRPYNYQESVVIRLAANPSTPLDILISIAQSGSILHRIEAVRTGRLPLSVVTNTLADLVHSSVYAAQECAASHEATPGHLLSLLGDAAHEPVLVALAANPRCPSATLQRLAHAPTASVRAAAAQNPATPGDVLMALARDVNDDVRAEAQRSLARR